MSSTTSATDPPRWATAFAPASVANVAIGFDILGFSVGALGDRVTVSRTETPGVTITDIRGLAGKLPMDPEENTAGRAMFLSTRQARGILRRSVELSDFVWQTANLAGFISGCYTNDLDMIRSSFEDVVIEPQRQALIPAFQAVRLAAMRAGALGCSISGAGPTLFAWALARDAHGVLEAMRREFAAASVSIDEWLVDISGDGASVIESG